MSEIYKTYEYPFDPLELLLIFKEREHIFFLDSSNFGDTSSRYSFIGFDPFEVFSKKGSDSLSKLKEAFNNYSKKEDAQPLPFMSGMVGFVSYDYGLYHEKIVDVKESNIDIPDVFFCFYDSVLVFDHLLKKLFITSTDLSDGLGKEKSKLLSKKLEGVIKRVDKFIVDKSCLGGEVIDGKCDLSNDLEGSLCSDNLKSNFLKQEYLNVVLKAKDYIEQGEIYQVNLSQRFELDLKGKKFDPIDLYRSLRTISPAGFSAYFDGGDFKLVSSSPERFISLRGDMLCTRPMKGTRPRGGTAELDEKLRQEIMKSEKDTAELLMITDLERNDLGKVCDYGSVVVNEMRTLEEYKNVFQTTANVEGILRTGKDCFDVIEACFPGGSITGCPKLRAMQIINELEPTKRNIYTGSLGYIDFSGNMDFNILIRTNKHGS